MKAEHIFALFMGIPALFWFYSLVGFDVTVAIFLMMWANNLSMVKK